jgi:hypothetical protein
MIENFVPNTLLDLGSMVEPLHSEITLLQLWSYFCKAGALPNTR